jgi:N-acetylmuramoyl-L-alanine amidase
VFKCAGFIFLGALIFLAGCASTPKMPDETISATEPTAGASALNWVDPKAAPPTPSVQLPAVQPAPKTNPPSPTANRAVVIVSKPAHSASTTWTSLNRWAIEHKLNQPTLLSKSPMTTYRVSSENGVMQLALGSHEVIWNGIELHLGFEPQIIDNQIFLHGLDLQKTFEPLLCAPPLTLGTNHVVVIDPGHGGSNVGTHSVVDGRYEKEFTLDWARRLKPLLEANGWTVYLTRSSDTYVTNADRGIFADAHHADLFISLHFNSAAPDTKQAGLETYVLTPTGMPSTLTRNYSDLWAEHFSNNNFDAANLQLAVRLQANLLQVTGETDRGVRRARFMDVLHEHNHPAVLIEGGYLSNPREAKRIADPEFRQKLAEAVATALRLNPEPTTSKIETNAPTASTNQPSKS